MNQYDDIFNNVVYDSKSFHPAVVPLTSSKSKKAASSDDLEGSRRASDSDLMAANDLVRAVRRRSSHRRTESDDRTKNLIDKGSGEEDVGFLSDGTPARSSRGRVSREKSDKTPSRDRASSSKHSRQTSSGDAKASGSTTSSTPTEKPEKSPLLEIASQERPRSSSSTRGGSRVEKPDSVKSPTPSPEPTKRPSSSSSGEKPRVRRGSDAPARVRRSSRAFEAPIVITPSSPETAASDPSSSSSTAPAETSKGLVSSKSSDKVVPATSSESKTTPDEIPVVKASPSVEQLKLPAKSPSAPRLASSSSAPKLDETQSKSASPPQSPSSSESDSTRQRTSSGSKQRVAALMGSGGSETTVTAATPSTGKSSPSVRLRSLLDAVSTESRSDAIGGVERQSPKSSQDSLSARRRSNSVSDSMSPKRRNWDRTSHLATLSFVNPEEFNLSMEITVRLKKPNSKWEN